MYVYIYIYIYIYIYMYAYIHIYTYSAVHTSVLQLLALGRVLHKPVHAASVN